MQAYNCYVEALRIQPKFAIAWSNLAGLFMEAGDLKKALQYYKVSNPDFCHACVCVWKGIWGGGGVEMANVCVYSKYVLYVCMHACIGIHVTSHSRFFLFFYFISDSFSLYSLLL